MKKIFIKLSQKISVIFLMCLILLPQAVIAQQKIDLTKYDEDGFLLEEQSALGEIRDEIERELESIPDYTLNPQGVKVGELASCFDYYQFGSVNVNLSTDFISYESGDPVMLQGTITNTNSYPLVGLDIKARLVKDIPAPESMRAEILILDEFDVADNITLDANGTFEVSYSHLLPLNAPSGQYQVYFYAVEQDRFNMSGLSFTNDIVASRIYFDVTGNTPDHVYLDQTQIVVGDQPHNVMAFMTQHESNTPVPVSIPLYNPGSESISMRVTYDLYSWDSALASNKLSSKTEIVVVSSKSEYQLEYVVENTSLPVYYLSISAEPTSQELDQSVMRQKTISNIRLVIQEQSKPRLNFVGVDTYPLKKNSEATLVTCFHNTSNEVDTNNTRIETVVYDQNNRELSRTEYVGSITPEISGLIHKFKSRRDVSEFTVVSTLYDASGSVIDTVTKVYACEDINSDMCTKKNSSAMIYLLITLILIAGLIAITFKRKGVNFERV